MFRIFSILLFTLSLNANTLNIDEKIKGLIGNQEYLINKSLIKHIFWDTESFYTYDNVNYIALIATLQNNGLLKIAFNKPKNLELTFISKNNSIKSFKILNDVLKSIGYYHYFTKELSYDENQSLKWIIHLKTRSAIDPLVFAEELYKYKSVIVNIQQKDTDNWVYEINTLNSIIPRAKNMIVGERLELKKPLKPYFIKIDDSYEINIISKYGNQWFPYIVFYDKHLKIISIIKEDKKHKKINLEIPGDTKYIKIDDIYTLSNIKRGLSVEVKE